MKQKPRLTPPSGLFQTRRIAASPILFVVSTDQRGRRVRLLVGVSGDGEEQESFDLLLDFLVRNSPVFAAMFSSMYEDLHIVSELSDSLRTPGRSHSFRRETPAIHERS